jgi:hypothetical protein
MTHFTPELCEWSPWLSFFGRSSRFALKEHRTRKRPEKVLAFLRSPAVLFTAAFITLLFYVAQRGWSVMAVVGLTSVMTLV